VCRLPEHHAGDPSRSDPAIATRHITNAEADEFCISAAWRPPASRFSLLVLPLEGSQLSWGVIRQPDPSACRVHISPRSSGRQLMPRVAYPLRSVRSIRLGFGTIRRARRKAGVLCVSSHRRQANRAIRVADRSTSSSMPLHMIDCVLVCSLECSSVQPGNTQPFAFSNRNLDLPYDSK
jgi:hypothetical protein